MEIKQQHIGTTEASTMKRALNEQPSNRRQ